MVLDTLRGAGKASVVQMVLGDKPQVVFVLEEEPVVLAAKVPVSERAEKLIQQEVSTSSGSRISSSSTPCSIDIDCVLRAGAVFSMVGRQVQSGIWRLALTGSRDFSWGFIPSQFQLDARQIMVVFGGGGVADAGHCQDLETFFSVFFFLDPRLDLNYVLD